MPRLFAELGKSQLEIQFDIFVYAPGHKIAWNKLSRNLLKINQYNLY